MQISYITNYLSSFHSATDLGKELKYFIAYFLNNP